MAKRTRNKSVTLRMTDKELELFQAQLEKSQAKNQTDFVLELLKNKPIIVNNDLVPVLVELKRQGNNLNQVARSLYENKELEESAKKILNECWLTYRKIMEMK